MKKILFSFLVVMIMASCVYGAENLKVGILTKLNSSPEDFQKMAPVLKSQGIVKEFREQPAPKVLLFNFYDSLATLLLAVNKGEVEEVYLPKDVAEYALKTSTSLEMSVILRLKNSSSLCFGFYDKEKGQKLKSLFNAALNTLENNGRLAHLREIYITNPKEGALSPAQFEKFDGAETIRVAVTGDLPPIDFIAEDGIPAGFNAAVLAEVAKNAKINIELVNIDSSARAYALKSGRVDVAFWYEIMGGINRQFDVLENVIISEPYYKFNEVFGLKKK